MIAFGLVFSILLQSSFDLRSADWGTVIGGGVSLFLLGNQYLVSNKITNAVDVHSTNMGAITVVERVHRYSPKQRDSAQMDKNGVLIGVVCLLPKLLSQSGLGDNVLTRALQMRCLPIDATTADVAFGVIEQGLVSAVVGANTQKYIAQRLPDAHPLVCGTISLCMAQLIPRLGVLMGMSPERQLLYTVLCISTQDAANRLRHVRGINLVAQELEHAAHVVPLMQAIGSLLHKNPSFYTCCSARIPKFGTDTSLDAYYVGVPTLTYAGVALGVELAIKGLRTTKLGSSMEQQFDRAVTPYVGELGNECIKHGFKQATELAITFGTLEYINNGSCTIL